MWRKKVVGVLAIAFLLCSASFAFAFPYGTPHGALAIWSLSDLRARLPEPSNHLGFNPMGESETREILRGPAQTAGSRYFLEYKTWRQIQTSA